MEFMPHDEFTSVLQMTLMVFCLFLHLNNIIANISCFAQHQILSDI